MAAPDDIQCAAGNAPDLRVKVAVSHGTEGHEDVPLWYANRQRFLVACHHVVPTGGILRFERLGRRLHEWGHELAFVALGDVPVPQGSRDIPILTLTEAAAQRWDAVMVPGAGFPQQTIEKLGVFRKPSFGMRVQHVLNDQSRRAGFEAVNRQFTPQVVIFNNLAWPVGSFDGFQADRFHVLLGAVDTAAFRPAAYRLHPLVPSRWVIGGLANKNPEALIAALEHLPEYTILRLFGNDTQGIAQKYAGLVAAGRVELTGLLSGVDLQRFYHSVDCIVMTEPNAGWANLVAEAMASGLPVVCTPHGTAAFARHEETALIVAEPVPSALAAAVLRLRGDRALCARLAEAGRAEIEAYSWDRYAQRLLKLIGRTDRQHHEV